MKTATLLVGVCAILLLVVVSVSAFSPIEQFDPPGSSGSGGGNDGLEAKCKQGLNNRYPACRASNYNAKDCCSYRRDLVNSCYKSGYYPALQRLYQRSCP